MKFSIKSIVLIFALFQSVMLFPQQESANDKSDAMFIVRGFVRESKTYTPIQNVSIQVNRGANTTTNSAGDFRIQVKKGDELIIKHEDFETVYYTILDAQRITIDVQPAVSNNNRKSRKYSLITFSSLIDSASIYLKLDAEKSIQFIAEALAESTSIKQNSEAYELLADTYMQWKQFDLAISNYKISLQNQVTNEVKLKLAEAYQKNKKYEESILIYNSIDKKELSNWQLTIIYEGIGDVYFITKNNNAAINSYKEGLIVAKEHLITPKITDLNSKIAQAYNASGNQKEAENYFENSLNLATQENKKRGLKEKVKVADFQNSNRLYSDEIELRKEAILDIEDIETDSILNNESPLTLQKQNYKIGNAYVLQKDYDKAIPYLEKSIEEADVREDLIVKKDATRKLLELYGEVGDYEKANSTYKSYTAIVDELYIKKEQEISQAARFSRDLIVKQNRITSLENERALSESKYQLTEEQSKRQQLIIYSLFGGLVLLLVTAYMMFKYIKHQKLTNNLLALKSLRSQMNPHFIFNALNSVNSFISSNDERTANRYLTDFSFLMRAVLENSEEDFIPLEKEIELLERYTKLEHFRFKDKFDYSIIVDKNININDFKIPPMLLQPYIENAVWHGLRYKKDKGKLDISIAQKKKDEIVISIVDNGIGRDKSKALKTDNQQKQNSKGMNNIKKRVAILNEMYKDKVDVSIDNYQSEGDIGTKVVVTLKKD